MITSIWELYSLALRYSFREKAVDSEIEMKPMGAVTHFARVMGVPREIRRALRQFVISAIVAAHDEAAFTFIWETNDYLNKYDMAPSLARQCAQRWCELCSGPELVPHYMRQIQAVGWRNYTQHVWRAAVPHEITL